MGDKKKKSEIDSIWKQQLESGYLDFHPFGVEGKTDVYWARNKFLDSIKDNVPEAVEDISNMLPVFSCLLEDVENVLSYQLTEGYKKKMLNLADIIAFFKNNPSENALLFVSELIKWSKKYNLDQKEEIWLINEIPVVLSIWLHNYQHRENLTFKYDCNHKIEIFIHETEKHLNQNKAYPFQDFKTPLPVKCYTKKDFLRLAEKYYEQQIDGYLSIGSSKSRRKQNDEHFKWLVLYKVKGYTYKEIAEECQISFSEETSAANIIGREVKKLANLIGLQINRRNPGRPKRMEHS